MSVAEWAIPLLGCCALLYTLPSISKGVKTKHYILIAIAILTLGFTLWNSWDNADKIDSLTSKANSLIKSNSIIQDSFSKVNNAITDLGLKIDEKTNKILITDSQLLKRSILKIVNHNERFFYSPTISNPSAISYTEQRHLTDSMIIKLRSIPKNYVVNIVYNPDKETAILTGEVKSKLLLMGYKISGIETSMMGAVPKQFEFMVSIDHVKKTAAIDIAEKAYYIE